MPTDTIEKVPQHEARAAEFTELRKQSHAQIEQETAERVKSNPKPTEEEITAGAFREMLEPQVRDAVFEMRKKGYTTESSGFGGKTGEVQQIDGNFEIDQQTAEMLRRNGIAVITREMDGAIPWKTSIRFDTGSVPGPLTIDKLKDKWEGIAHLLPDLEKPAEPSISGGTEDFIKERAPERTDVLNRIKELREKYEREQEEATRQREAETGTDRRYAAEVTRYFGAAREVARIGTEPGDEEYSYEDFLAEQQRTLEKLANPKKAERMTPEETSLALSDLAGNMAMDNPDNPSNRTGDPKQDAENEKQYLEAKRLFMESAAKIFPDAKPDFSELVSTLERLRASNDFPSEAGVADAEVAKLLQNNPGELARILDDALFLGGKMKEDAWVAYGSADRPAREAKLATASEALYKLQLLRDQLQKEIYGRAEIPPSDARKIDEIREEFKPAPSGGEKPKVKYFASEYGLYTPEAAKALQTRVEGLTVSGVAETMKDVADFLSTRPESHNLAHLEKQMRELGRPLESDNPTEEQLAAALKGVEHQYRLVQWVPSLHEKMLELNAMRHFLKRELQKMREAKSKERGKEISPELKALKAKFGFAKTELERSLGKSLSALGMRGDLGNDMALWQKAADGLEEIRRAGIKDKEPWFKKAPKYEAQIRKLFESLKR